MGALILFGIVLFVLNSLLMENAPADAGFEGLDTGDGSAVGEKSHRRHVFAP